MHTDEPERATAAFEGAGEVSRLDVADMRAQIAERQARFAASNGADSDGLAALDGGVQPGRQRRRARCAPAPR